VSHKRPSVAHNAFKNNNKNVSLEKTEKNNNNNNKISFYFYCLQYDCSFCSPDCCDGAAQQRQFGTSLFQCVSQRINVGFRHFSTHPFCEQDDVSLTSPEAAAAVLHTQTSGFEH
jgi:hypothetical protein